MSPYASASSAHVQFATAGAILVVPVDRGVYDHRSVGGSVALFDSALVAAGCCRRQSCQPLQGFPPVVHVDDAADRRDDPPRLWLVPLATGDAQE